MIAFACRHCGARHERPDDAAGTLVFCQCGHGNRVPWESMMPPGEAPPRQEDVPPVLEAIPVEERDDDLRPPRRRPSWGDVPAHDPAYCFNHQDVPTQHTCPACGLSFCEACVVRLQGQLLCGPCKNFRVRQGQRPPRTSVLAIASLVVALVGGPFSFCLMSASAETHEPIVGFIGLLGPLVAVGLGAGALWGIERNPQVAGRSLALTGIVAGCVSAVAVGIMVVLIGRMAG